jgi:hypothetical protein
MQTVVPPTPLAKPARKRGSAGSIYPYDTADGTRYRFTFRDARGKQSTRRGFLTRRAARAERERLMGKVHTGQLRVSKEKFGGFWTYHG